MTDTLTICPLFRAALLSNPNVTDENGDYSGYYAGEKEECIKEICMAYDRTFEKCKWTGPK